ncbi:hypothetical protein EDD16DRAFT_1523138 [Pisolithus croceorrhizus]|nr:hypothetical protein EDD16DRAFT_1523138 [Pisolithus croceorrhizus]KAI6158341.1 hypothetical protein EDD17DRAFT_1512249 [Pisolithus thermaeus]
MPRYQVLVNLVDALPEQEHEKGPKVDFPYWATWTWSAKELQSAKFSSSSRGLDVVLGLGLLLRECSHTQEVEEDDSLLGMQRGDGTMGPQGGDGGAGMGESDGGDEEKEKEEEEAPPRKRKRAGSGMVKRGQKMA